jgi:hypothetical protein
MSYLRLNYIGKSSLRLVIKENEKKEPDYITKYQYQSKIRQKPSSTPPSLCRPVEPGLVLPPGLEYCLDRYTSPLQPDRYFSLIQSVVKRAKDTVPIPAFKSILLFRPYFLIKHELLIII